MTAPPGCTLTTSYDDDLDGASEALVALLDRAAWTDLRAALDQETTAAMLPPDDDDDEGASVE